LLLSAALLIGGTTGVVVAPLPGAIWTVVANDENGGDHGDGHDRSRAASQASGESADSHKDGGQDQHIAKPTGQLAAQPPAADHGDGHGQAGTAPASAPNAAASTASGGTAPAPQQVVEATSTSRATDHKPSATKNKRMTEDVLGAIRSIPGQLIDPGTGPIGASKGSGIAAILFSLVWACVSGVLVVVVRRHMARRRNDPDFVPMTLGTYDFRE
jgi:hypothetical protein